VVKITPLIPDVLVDSSELLDRFPSPVSGFLSAGTWPSDLFIEHGTYFLPASQLMKSTHHRPDFAKSISRLSLYFHFMFMILHGPSAYNYRQSGGFWLANRG
jgi:hypothetical protein